MRDRREVLKLLAGGTAVAAGASLITTSTAFADGGTLRCRAAVGSIETPSNLEARMQSSGQDPAAIRLTVADANGLTLSAADCSTCDRSATGSTSYKWTFDSVPNTTYGLFNSRTSTTDVKNAWQTGTNVATSWFITPGSGTPAAGPYVVRLTVRWSCAYTRNNASKVAWRCAHYTFSFTLLATTNNSSVTPSLSALGTGDSAACDT